MLGPTKPGGPLPIGPTVPETGKNARQTRIAILNQKMQNEQNLAGYILPSDLSPTAVRETFT